MSQEAASWMDTGVASEISDGTCKPIEIMGRQILVVRLGEEIYALSNICSHQFALMSDGYIDGREIEFPLHQARFDIPSGRPLCPPATKPLRTFPVKVEDGTIFVAIQNE